MPGQLETNGQDFLTAVRAVGYGRVSRCGRSSCSAPSPWLHRWLRRRQLRHRGQLGRVPRRGGEGGRRRAARALRVLLRQGAPRAGPGRGRRGELLRRRQPRRDGRGVREKAIELAQSARHQAMSGRPTMPAAEAATPRVAAARRRAHELVRRRGPCGDGFAGYDDGQRRREDGAMKCAPRELAIARSQLRVRDDRSRSGAVSLAQAHLAGPSPTPRPPSRTARPTGAPRASSSRWPPRSDGHRRRRHRDSAISASTSPRTRTATSTTTAAPIRTTTPTVSPTPPTSAPTSRRTSTASRTRTAARPGQRRRPGGRPRRLLSEYARRPRRRPPRLPEEELAHRGDGAGDPHHPADPVRVQQGRHPAWHKLQILDEVATVLPRTRRSASRSRATPTTSAGTGTT